MDDHPLLTAAEELELLRRRPDKASVDTLILANARFAARMAHKYSGRGVDVDDLISEAVLGLMEGIRRWEEEHNVRLLTYANYWIHNYLHRALTSVPESGADVYETDAEAAVTVQPYAEDELVKLRVAASTLPEQMRMVLKLRFEEGLTCEAAGERLGLCKQRIGAVQREALEQLRSMLCDE